MRRLLASTTLAALATPAVAQTNPPNLATSLSNFQIGFPWAPNGEVGPQMGSVWPGSSSPPGVTAPVTSTGSGLSLGVVPIPAGVSAASVQGATSIGSLVTTRNLPPQTYGYYQVTAKMCGAPGTMSAFYLNPSNGTWPPEPDIFEILANDPTMLTNTIHSNVSANDQTDTTKGMPNLTTSYNTYAFDWTPSTLTWYFNGVETKQVPTPSDMNQPMYAMLDTTAGTPGSWEGAAAPNASCTMNVSNMQILPSNPYADQAAAVSAAQTLNAAGTLGAGSTSGLLMANPATIAAEQAAVATAQTALATANQQTTAVKQSVDAAISAEHVPAQTGPGKAFTAPSSSQLGCQPVTAPQLNPGLLTVAQVAALAAVGGLDPRTGPATAANSSTGCPTGGN